MRPPPSDGRTIERGDDNDNDDVVVEKDGGNVPHAEGREAPSQLTEGQQGKLYLGVGSNADDAGGDTMDRGDNIGWLPRRFFHDVPAHT